MTAASGATPARMRRVAAARRKYGAIAGTQVQNSLAYPLDLAGRALSILLFLWVFVHLWEKAFAGAGVSTIGGLTYADTLWYLLITETIVLSKPRIAEDIARSVRDGSVAYILNKPYDFALYHFASGLGDSLARAVVTLLAGGLLVWVNAGPPPSLLGVALAPAAMLAAWAIDFCMSALIGLSAFVVEDVSAFDWIYSKLVLILGGVLIPLEFFPERLGAVAAALPFAWTAWAPARLFVAPDAGMLATVLVGQLAWAVVLGGSSWWAQRAGSKRLAINGG